MLFARDLLLYAPYRRLFSGRRKMNRHLLT
ncbi:Uncharacterised protein [Vibrio cholerae]|nr:Uncharacterised protein [Vibrio cholerae]